MKYRISIILGLITNMGISQTTMNLQVNLEQQNSLKFTENKGQIQDKNRNGRPDILYYGQQGQLRFYLKEDGVVYRLDEGDSIVNEYDSTTMQMHAVPKKIKANFVKVNWLNTNPNKTISTQNQTAELASFYLFDGDNATEIEQVRSYQKVVYTNLYQGIDLHTYEHNGKLKNDYVVHPGADYSKIRMQVTGGQVNINTDGSVSYQLGEGSVSEEAPKIYQNGTQLSGNWKLTGNTLSFEVNGYNPTQEMTIDPTVTYLVPLTAYEDNAKMIDFVTDQTNNVYILSDKTNPFGTITGINDVAYSINIPPLPNIHLNQVNLNSSSTGDLFSLYKYDETGALLASKNFFYSYTNNLYDKAEMNDLAIDNNQNVYICGGFRRVFNQNYADYTFGAFVFKLQASDLKLLWKSGLVHQFLNTPLLLHHTDYLSASSICADHAGNVFMAGNQHFLGFPSIAQNTPSGLESTNSSIFPTGFVAKFNSTGTLLWSGYLPSNDLFGTEATSCILAPDNSLYVAGGALPANLSADFFGPALTTRNYDGYLLKFNTAGERSWRRIIGGTFNEIINGISCDQNSNLYFMGSTASNDAPIVNGDPQLTRGGLTDAYVGRISPLGNLDWSNYLGGSANDFGNTCSFDFIKQQLLVGGTTQSSTLIATTDGYDQVKTGAIDYFAVKFCNGGGRIWSTYMPFPAPSYAKDRGLVNVSEIGVIYMGGFDENKSRIFSFAEIQVNVFCDGIPASDSLPFSTEKLPLETCKSCLSGMQLTEGKYILTVWVQVPGASPTISSYTTPQVNIQTGNGGPGTVIKSYKPSGQIIDGWQRIEAEMNFDDRVSLEVTGGGTAYFDDIRLHPKDGSMKSYVYDSRTLRMIAELDERNYATIYEYDEEGKLIRVKKETEKGIMTIQENRSNIVKQ